MQYAQNILKINYCLPYVTVRAKFTKSQNTFLTLKGDHKLKWLEISQTADVTLSRLRPAGHGV